MNAVYKKVGVNTEPPGDTVVGAWISPDGHYAFVEFRTPEEATTGLNALSGGGVKIMGYTLKTGRPKQFTQTIA